MKPLLSLSIALPLLAATACHSPEKPVELQEGDLLFQTCTPTAFTDAIMSATKNGDELDFSHVGIFTCADGDSMVIEASTKGVVLTPLSEFLSGDNERVVAMRVASHISATKAVERALSHLGEPYDWEFAPDNGKMYCSELVQNAYLLDDGTSAFESVPMNFKAADGSTPQFWIDLFDSLGKPIPQDMPGTNPNSIFRSPHLSLVKTF